MLKIAVIGSGYVGLVAAACFAELGHEVHCVDSNPERIAALSRGECPIHERFLPELLARHNGKRLRFGVSVAAATETSQVIFIAVGTPSSPNGALDLSYVEAVSREIAPVLAAHPRDYKVIAEKSTVPVDTNRGIRRVMELNAAPAAAFDIASTPEFLREGTAVADFLYPDRIVIGADSERAIAILSEAYRPLTDGSYYQRPDCIPGAASPALPARLIITSARSAELTKHAANAFLAMKISFINALAGICESVGASVEEVRQGLGSDSRIGSRFLNPGIGFGGSCFPKDLKAFRASARDCGYDFSLLDEVMKINDDQRARFVAKLRSALWILKGKRLAVLGLAFKGGTDDIRESQAIAIISLLLQEGASVSAYDPAAMGPAKKSGVFAGQNLAFAADAYEAAKGADALVILTDWEDFLALDLARIRSLLKHPIIADGRNLFSPQAMAALGFTYISVGRPVATPTAAALSSTHSSAS